MNASATASRQEKSVITLPFFNIPKLDREDLFQKITFIIGSDLEKLDTRIAKTACKSLAGKQGCCIVDKPKIITKSAGDVLHIPIKNTPHPVEVSVKFLRSILQLRMGNI